MKENKLIRQRPIDSSRQKIHQNNKTTKQQNNKTIKTIKTIKTTTPQIIVHPYR